MQPTLLSHGFRPTERVFREEFSLVALGLPGHSCALSWLPPFCWVEDLRVSPLGPRKDLFCYCPCLG